MLCVTHDATGGRETMDAELREAYRFHFEHGGWIVGRRAEGALRTARAELRLREEIDAGRASVEWVDDSEPYDPGDVCTTEEAAEKFASDEWTGPYGCIVMVGDEDASLWGIVVGSRGTNDPYCRVVEAELAAELFYRLDAEAAEAARAARHDIATVAR